MSITTDKLGRKRAITTFKPQRPLHRVLMNAPKGMDVDHINGEDLDNRKANLRVVTRQINLRNRTTGKRGRTAPLGVYQIPCGAWSARIGKHYLGAFKTMAEAQYARLSKEKEMWGIAPRRLPEFQEAGLA